jgi:hypothetical protein
MLRPAVGDHDCEGMLEGAQRVWITTREQVRPGGHLSRVAEEGGEKTVQPAWHPPREQRNEPHERKDDQRQDGPQAQHDVLRHEDEDAEENGEPPSPQRLFVVNSQTALVHLARYRTDVRQAALLLFVLLVVGGCGGDSGKQLTRQEYASKADAICAKYNERTKGLGNPTSLSELADTADKTLDILENAIGELKDLEPPASERATADQWIAAVEQLKTDLAEIRDKANDNDMQAVQAVVPRATQHNKRSNELATELGMSVCNMD